MSRSCPPLRVLPHHGRLGLGFDPQDAHHLLPGPASEAQFCRTEEPVDDQDIAVDPGVHDLQFPIGAEHEERRHLAPARIGIAAIDVCRPLPFLGETRPKISDVFGELISSSDKDTAKDKKRVPSDAVED